MPFLACAGKAGHEESKAHTAGITTQKQEASQHPEVESTLGLYRLHTPIEGLVYFSFTREKKDKFSSKSLKLNADRCPGSWTLRDINLLYRCLGKFSLWLLRPD